MQWLFSSASCRCNYMNDFDMSVSYKKLWKLLIDKDMKKKDLEKAAGISNYVVSKMNKGENITVDIVGRICSALDCTPNDIMEFNDDSK